MPTAERRFSVRSLYPVIALLALLPGGCLLAIAGVCAGAAGTGYLYARGRVYRDYPAALPAVHTATHNALLDLHFAIFNEEAKDGKAFLCTKTTAGKKVKVYLDSLSSPIPSEGVVTRVSIRVATFGDEGVSGRILDQIAWRLSNPPAAAPGPPPGPPVGPPVPIQPTSATRPFETTPPPLAPAPNKK